MSQIKLPSDSFLKQRPSALFNASSFLIPLKAECLIYCNVNQREAEIKIHGSVFCFFSSSSSSKSDFFIVAVVYL